MQSALSKLSGVVKAEVTMPDKAIITVEKGKVTNDQLIAAVKKAGYGASLKTDKKEK